MVPKGDESPGSRGEQARRLRPGVSKQDVSGMGFAESEPFTYRGRNLAALAASRRHQGGYSGNSRFKLWFNYIAFRHPARLSISIFAILITVFTLLLMLPAANTTGSFTPPTDALFTSVSAVCVTGLAVVDTATYWTFFGQVIIAIAISLGGFGVMTMASLLALVVSRRLGLTQRLLSTDDTQGRMGDALTLIMGVLVTTLVAEAVLFFVLFPSFLNSGHSFASATWSALFLSISSFNNAGFVNLPEGMDPYIGNWFVLLPLMLAAALGAIGFPVITDLRRRWRTPRSWSLHTKITLSTYITLALVSGIVVAILEWNNPYTFGTLTGSEKLLNSVVASLNPRSLGISAIDVGQMTGASWLITDISMFIGGGSGSHAGGIKVTTFTVLLLAAWTEARGKRDVEAFHRRVPYETVRQAVAVLLAATTLVFTVATLLLVMTPFPLDRVLFETISAFGTVGLSTGITPALPNPAKILLSFLMVTGRVGPMTLAAALALRQTRTMIRQPEERPIVG